MQIYILIIFVLSCLFSYLYFLKESKPQQIIIFLILGILIFIICVLRDESNVRDYGAYLEMFKYKTDSVEISFNLLRNLIIRYFSGNVTYLFWIYAIIGILLKLYSIYKLSTNIILSFVIYVSYIYIVQDLTAIRVGASTSFLLLSIPYAINRNLIKFLLMALLATFFHSSAFIVIFLWFLNPKDIKPYYYIIILILSYFLIPILSDTLNKFQSYLPIYLQNKILSYEIYDNTEINIFNFWQIIRVILTIYFLLNASNLFKKNENSILLVKIYFLSTISYIMLSFNPAYAGRISEIFIVVDILLLPQILLTVRPKFKLICNLFILIVAFSYLYLNLFYLNLIN
jgi:hypothetical protein